MENATMHTPDSGAAKTAAEKNGSRKSRMRGIDYVAMIAIGLAVSLGCFFGLDRLFTPSLKASSADRELATTRSSNGSVHQVESWIQENRQAPGTIEYIDWSPVYELPGGCFSVKTRYVSKYASGEYVVENRVFFLDMHGNVTNTWILPG